MPVNRLQLTLKDLLRVNLMLSVLTTLKKKKHSPYVRTEFINYIEHNIQQEK